jgi:hypothetical protein
MTSKMVSVTWSYSIVPLDQEPSNLQDTHSSMRSRHCDPLSLTPPPTLGLMALMAKLLRDMIHTPTMTVIHACSNSIQAINPSHHCHREISSAVGIRVYVPSPLLMYAIRLGIRHITDTPGNGSSILNVISFGVKSLCRSYLTKKSERCVHQLP